MGKKRGGKGKGKGWGEDEEYFVFGLPRTFSKNEIPEQRIYSDTIYAPDREKIEAVEFAGGQKFVFDMFPEGVLTPVKKVSEYLRHVEYEFSRDTIVRTSYEDQGGTWYAQRDVITGKFKYKRKSGKIKGKAFSLMEGRVDWNPSGDGTSSCKINLNQNSKDCEYDGKTYALFENKAGVRVRSLQIGGYSKGKFDREHLVAKGLRADFSDIPQYQFFPLDWHLNPFDTNLL